MINIKNDVGHSSSTVWKINTSSLTISEHLHCECTHERKHIYQGGSLYTNEFIMSVCEAAAIHANDWLLNITNDHRVTCKHNKQKSLCARYRPCACVTISARGTSDPSNNHYTCTSQVDRIVQGAQFDEDSENMPRYMTCLLYTSPSPRDGLLSRMPSSA